MSKLTVSIGQAQLPELLSFVEKEFNTKPYATPILDDMKKAVEEIFLSIVNAGDLYTCLHMDISITKDGCCIQLLYPGPIFNPCSKDRKLCPFTQHAMDELSFEFKYGHSVVAIYKNIK